MGRGGPGKPRRATIDAEKYFPNKGDCLDDLEAEVTYLCARVDLFIDKETNTKIRYGLLIGRHPDHGKTPIPISCLERDRAYWLGTYQDRQDGGGIQRIRRVRDDGVERVYDYDPIEDCYVFDPQRYA